MHDGRIVKLFVKTHWPELCLLAAGAYFFCRELGGFPAAWTDDSIFMAVARMVADGKGYAMPILDHAWFYPPFLGAGPPLVLPSALAIRLFGFSVAVARLPMVIYLALTCLVFYKAAKEWSGLLAARLGTALLITLSAFVNNGKPVLGEVPGIFFMLAGLLFILRTPLSWRLAILAGTAAGLSILSKITFAPILGAFVVVALVRWHMGKKTDMFRIAAACGVALVVYLPWFLVENAHGSSILQEAMGYLSGNLTSDSVIFHVVRRTPEVLLRVPFLAFVVTLVLGMIGLWSVRAPERRALQWSLTSLIGLYLLYYLDLFGWYRHLLPAHVLLLPFVPVGAQKLLGRSGGILLILAIIGLQGWWQLTYRGSSRSTTGIETAQYLMDHYADQNILIQQPEVFVRLPWNPHWLQLMPDTIAVTFPADLREVPASHLQAPLLTKYDVSQPLPPCMRAEQIAGSYHLLFHTLPCPSEGMSDI